MFSCILVRYHNDQLADLAILHPPIQCGHDLADICFDLVVARYKHIEAILFYHGEILGWVDAALVEDRMDRILELGAFKKNELEPGRGLRGRGEMLRRKTYKLGHQLRAAL